ncbi:MAG: exo-alpha-sialidase [Acidobacteria bacterium]|nr:exo-alpha-sialidase [Acidobacteriota bacterium]
MQPLPRFVAVLAALSLAACSPSLDPAPVKKRVRDSIDPAVVAAVPDGGVRIAAPPPPPGGFTQQARLGYTSGDQWEPAIAADNYGHVYVLAPQYQGVPGCATCPSPTMILQVSSDGGQSFGPPRQIAAPGTGQWDAQIEVDPVDGQTVFAAWLQNGKSDTVVARSVDYGQTWTTVVADSTNAGTDKPILAVRGLDVYVAFNHAQKAWVASSHDGGLTFTQHQIDKNGKLGWALVGGGTVTPNGAVHYAWAGYERNGGATGNVNLFVSSSSDGGTTWTSRVVDISAAPPDCSAYSCGWAYLGAQMSVASDATGKLYVLWNANAVARAPNRLYFATSADGGASWSPRVEVSTAAAGSAHAFPALVARGAGDVRIGWMDARGGAQWNTWYRSSTNGGATWSAERDLSTFVPGFSYIQADGYAYPYGDYWELTVDGQGKTHAVWGEGLNYDSPGSIWYARQQ